MSGEHPILPQRSTHPHTAGSRPGFVYFNTTDLQIYYDTGYVWQSLGVPFNMQVRRWNFTAAQALTFGASPVQILPAVTGYAYRLFDGVFIKRSGPAFTGTAFAQPKWMASTPVAAMNFGVANVIDQTTEESSVATGVINTVASVDANQIGSKAVALGTNGNVNWGGTGSDVMLGLAFSLIPATAAALEAAYPLSA